jgi:hypothetical protein
MLKCVSMDDHSTFVFYWIEEDWDGKFYAKSQNFMYKKPDFLPMLKMVEFNQAQAALAAGSTTSDPVDEDGHENRETPAKGGSESDARSSTVGQVGMPAEESSTLVIILVVSIGGFLAIMMAVLCTVMYFFLKKRRLLNQVGIETAEHFNHASISCRSKSNEPLSERNLKRLFKKHFRKFKFRGNQTSLPVNCTLCEVSFIEDESLTKIGVCKHNFHSNCLNEWLKTGRSCPICKKDLSWSALENIPFYDWTEYSPTDRMSIESAKEPNVFVQDCKKWEQRKMDLEQGRHQTLKPNKSKKYKKIPTQPHKS